jgi:hypothetical protein
MCAVFVRAGAPLPVSPTITASSSYGMASPALLPAQPSASTSSLSIGSAAAAAQESLFTAPSAAEFQRDLNFLMSLVLNGPCKTFAHNRLHILEARFNLHGLLNHDIEAKAQKVLLPASRHFICISFLIFTSSLM